MKLESGTRVLLLLTLLSATPLALAQPQRDTPFYVDTISYDPAIPLPESVIGHTLGHRVLRPGCIHLRKLRERMSHGSIPSRSRTRA